MQGDPEIDNWRNEWTAQADIGKGRSVDIRRSAAKQQRRLRTGHVLELLFGLMLLLFSAAIAWRNPTPETYLWAVVVWAGTAAVTAFSVWNWRILWKADLKSVSEYVLDYEKRCHASLRAARYGMRFLAVQLLIAVPWLTWDYLHQHLTGPIFAESIGLLTGLALGFWLFFTRFKRTALRELNEIRESQQIPRE